MERKMKYLAVLLACSCLGATAYADNTPGNHEIIMVGADTGKKDEDYESTVRSAEVTAMLPDTVYDMDLDGDGTMEKVSFRSVENEDEQGNCTAALEIYQDRELLWSYQDTGWSYYWTLTQFSMEDGPSCFLAVSRSDNDWNSQALLLTKPEGNDAFEVMADLAELTRESEDETDRVLSGWARIGYEALLTVSDHTFTVPWSETLKATGNLTAFVEYQMENGTVTLTGTPILLDEQRTWTAWHEFDVYDQPGSDTVLFHVSADDVVQLTELVKYQEKDWLKCTNSEGVSGWFPDSEEFMHQPSEEHPEEYEEGYFKEAIFAG